MSTTEPIRNKTDLQKFMNYYAAIQPNPRNQALILLGLYTALRIGDILQLKWRMVYDFNKHHFFDHIYVNEQKTQKLNVIALNQHVKASLIVYFEIRNPEPEDYIFTKRTTPQRPINRSQAFRIVQKAAECTGGAVSAICEGGRTVSRDEGRDGTGGGRRGRVRHPQARRADRAHRRIPDRRRYTPRRHRPQNCAHAEVLSPPLCQNQKSTTLIPQGRSGTERPVLLCPFFGAFFVEIRSVF